MTRTVVTLVGTAFAATAIAFAQQPSQSTVSTANSVVGVSKAVVSTGVALAEDYEYVGSKKCKKCHIKEYKSWEKLRHGDAFDTLKPGKASEAKTKAGLDVSKDYSTDGKCIKCHTVGYGHKGGYATPDPADKKAVKEAKYFENVGCECCHGPGSGYIEVFEDIQKSKRQYTDDELKAKGLIFPDETTCKTCHNDESPSFGGFDYAAQVKEGVHELIPLKLKK